VVLISSWS